MSLVKFKNNKKPVFINSFLNRLWTSISLALVLPLAHAASLSWDGEQLSSAITPASPSSQQFFMPAQAVQAQASSIGKVEVSYHHNGRAILKSRLCLQGGKCVDMNGSVLSTRAFAGQDARLGFVLMHEVWSWAGSTEPVRVQASIRVNYQP
ncbi:hypothetical protein QWA_02780 [Alcaligenes faecalis subsp. faecalis NCIB 8687]|jgi:flagellar protein FlhE|nr:hypothetical protein QWA_02780 [Alcaligenes faecalis subsp. faecalis NCIB 8687]